MLEKQNKEFDIVILKTLLKSGVILGVIPTNSLQHQKIYYIYATCLVIFYILVTVSFFTFGLLMEDAKTTAEIFFAILEWLTLLCFSVVCVIHCIQYRREWRKIIRNIDKIDDLLYNRRYQRPISYQKKIFLNYLLFSLVLTIIVYNAYYYPWTIWKLQYSLLAHQRFYITIILIHIVTLFKNRCDKADRYLKDIFVDHFQYNVTKIKKSIKKLQVSIYLINENIELFNTFFGISILLMSVGGFADILGGFTFVFTAVNQGTSFVQAIVDTGAYAFYILIIPVSIIFCVI